MAAFRKWIEATVTYLRLTFYRITFAAAFLGFGYIVINAVHLQPSERAMLAAKHRASPSHVLLQTGGRADLIRGVQRELINLGYDPGLPNGIATLQTRAAIWAWQYDNQRPITAEVSEDLLKQLIFGVGRPNGADSGEGRKGHGPGGPGQPETAWLQAKTARAITKPIEKILAELGYAPGAVDGFFDNRTRQAILAFEQDREMPQTGRISGRLIAEIRRITSAAI